MLHAYLYARCWACTHNCSLVDHVGSIHRVMASRSLAPVVTLGSPDESGYHALCEGATEIDSRSFSPRGRHYRTATFLRQSVGALRADR